MKAVAIFEKVSFEQFYKDILKNYYGISEQDSTKELDMSIRILYDNIQKPKRATKGSSGYDFYLPVPDFDLHPNQEIVIPTGIRCKIDEGYDLTICPRSGLGFKYRVRLANTLGIIDQDYYYSDNEGHVMVKLSNETSNGAVVFFKTGNRFCQGIFREYFIIKDDNCTSVRNGGLGSSGK